METYNETITCFYIVLIFASLITFLVVFQDRIKADKFKVSSKIGVLKGDTYIYWVIERKTLLIYFKHSKWNFTEKFKAELMAKELNNKK